MIGTRLDIDLNAIDFLCDCYTYSQIEENENSYNLSSTLVIAEELFSLLLWALPETTHSDYFLDII